MYDNDLNQRFISFQLEILAEAVYLSVEPSYMRSLGVTIASGQIAR